MTNCHSCSKQIPEASSFCPFCAVPVKCKACGEAWLKDAVACFQCGTKLDAVGSTHASNSIQFEQTGKNRKLTAYFSDNVGAQLSGVLHGLVSGQPPEYRSLPAVNAAGTPTRKALTFASGIPAIQDAVIEGDDEKVKLGALSNVFRVEGDHLVLYDHRLKQTSQLDFAKRLSILFLYAHQLQGNHLVARTALNAILTQEKVNDGNTRHWLAKAGEVQIREDGQVELRPAGVDKAKLFLSQIADATIEQKNVVIGGGKNGKRKATEDGEPGTTSSTKTKSSGSNKVGAWKGLGLLADEGYFATKRSVSEMQKYCADDRAWHFKVNEITSCLSRMVKSRKFKRERDAADGQFMYFKA